MKTETKLKPSISSFFFPIKDWSGLPVAGCLEYEPLLLISRHLFALRKTLACLKIHDHCEITGHLWISSHGASSSLHTSKDLHMKGLEIVLNGSLVLKLLK